jgi:hypothetical protein
VFLKKNNYPNQLWAFNINLFMRFNAVATNLSQRFWVVCFLLSHNCSIYIFVHFSVDVIIDLRRNFLFHTISSSHSSRNTLNLTMSLCDYSNAAWHWRVDVREEPPTEPRPISCAIGIKIHHASLVSCPSRRIDRWLTHKYGNIESSACRRGGPVLTYWAERTIEPLPPPAEGAELQHK